MVGRFLMMRVGRCRIRENVRHGHVVLGRHCGGLRRGPCLPSVAVGLCRGQSTRF
jgi:hypothetical protein